MTTFRVGSASDVGQVRSNNQDSKLVSDGVGVYAVADGMGGHQGGEVASAIAVETLEAIITDPTTPSVVEAVKEANRRIFSRAADSAELRGMGTTLVAIALVNQGTDDEEVAWVNVGDSRVYLLRDEELHQLSRDHSLVEDLRRGGQLSDEEAAVHPQRNILTRALGIDQDVEVDTGAVVPLKGDRFLLCSDGLFNEVDRATLIAVLSEGDDPDAIATELVRLANAGGGRDNITCVVADVVDDGGRAERAAAAVAVAGETGTVPDDADLAPTREMPAVAADEDVTEVAEAPSTAAPPPGAPPTDPGLGPPPPPPPPPPPAPEAPAAPPAEGTFPTPPDPGFPGGEEDDDDRPSDADLPFGRSTTDLYDDLDHAGGRHKVVTALVALIVLAGIAGAAYLGLSWYANRTVFLGTDGDEVVVYRGTPGGFLIFDPSIEERTDLTLDDLEDEVVDDVRAEREFDSVDDALSRVNSGQVREEPEEEPTTTTTEADSSTTGSEIPNSGPTTTTAP
ncbi:Stp1/IreP family PP2C-type Ser/Thr phosphatase [Iamia sp. SCSIO 61187]|uniref:Stp1/IreP family PP2C-type Ser/Thr phosphatase n=1 Tax=Iamia sp. SCSIO 61187 TaxID=2722752 RepID=UPI001C624F8C|nr:Stp1/IreP family PP2C-type Ser/Thr phosphatase [Iamia sp. SCSIO 61187]QYG91054.1 Stp1/IreP family PP2C-type Ser/Thr phosphatase [Iamia sp. SCSIO 61187]